MEKSLPVPDDHWRSRWLVTGEQTHLHRISSIEWEDGEMICGDGVSVCGISDHFIMPGLLSRMGLARCPDCCAALAIPEGEGAPFNQEGVSWSDV